MGFDINKQPTEIWATYIPSRSPVFKIYNKLGHATSSLKSTSFYSLGLHNIPYENKLYKLVNGKWDRVNFWHIYEGKDSIICNDNNGENV